MKYNIEIRFKEPDPNRVIGDKGRMIDGADAYGFNPKKNIFKVYRTSPFLDYTVDFDAIRELIIRGATK